MHSRMQYTVRRPIETKENSSNEFVHELAENIIARYEHCLFGRILEQNMEGEHPYQRKQILSMLPTMENHPQFGSDQRLHAIQEDLKAYFDEYETANIEGLVRFRLKRYLSLLEQTAEYVREMYLSKKEYDEFVELLKYFVSVQNERAKLLHVVIEECGVYQLYDIHRRNITRQCFSGWFSEQERVKANMDDLLISVLITEAPKRVIIHGVERMENMEFLTTIRTVFDKTEYCGGCELCRKKKR